MIAIEIKSPAVRRKKKHLRISPIFRPSHCPVFDCLQYAKTEVGGRPGPFYHMNDVLQCLRRYRQRGGEFFHQQNKLETISCSFCPNSCSFEHLQSRKRYPPGSKQKKKTCSLVPMQATSRFYLHSSVEKNRQKAWYHYNVMKRKSWTQLACNVHLVS